MRAIGYLWIAFMTYTSQLPIVFSNSEKGSIITKEIATAKMYNRIKRKYLPKRTYSPLIALLSHSLWKKIDLSIPIPGYQPAFDSLVIAPFLNYVQSLAQKELPDNRLLFKHIKFPFSSEKVHLLLYGVGAQNPICSEYFHQRGNKTTQKLLKYLIRKANYNINLTFRCQNSNLNVGKAVYDLLQQKPYASLLSTILSHKALATESQLVVPLEKLYALMMGNNPDLIPEIELVEGIPELTDLFYIGSDRDAPIDYPWFNYIIMNFPTEVLGSLTNFRMSCTQKSPFDGWGPLNFILPSANEVVKRQLMWLEQCENAHLVTDNVGNTGLYHLLFYMRLYSYQTYDEIDTSLYTSHLYTIFSLLRLPNTSLQYTNAANKNAYMLAIDTKSLVPFHLLLKSKYLINVKQITPILKYSITSKTHNITMYIILSIPEQDIYEDIASRVSERVHIGLAKPVLLKDYTLSKIRTIIAENLLFGNSDSLWVTRKVQEFPFENETLKATKRIVHKTPVVTKRKTSLCQLPGKALNKAQGLMMKLPYECILTSLRTVLYKTTRSKAYLKLVEEEKPTKSADVTSSNSTSFKETFHDASPSLKIKNKNPSPGLSNLSLSAWRTQVIDAMEKNNVDLLILLLTIYHYLPDKESYMSEKQMLLIDALEMKKRVIFFVLLLYPRRNNFLYKERPFLYSVVDAGERELLEYMIDVGEIYNDSFSSMQLNEMSNYIESRFYFKRIFPEKLVRDEKNHDEAHTGFENKILLDKKYSICSDTHDTALHQAVVNKDAYEVLRLVLDKKHPVNLYNGDGILPIDIAFELKESAIIKTLMDAGSSCHSYTTGKNISILFWAISTGDYDLILRVIKCGSSVHLHDELGNTVLMHLMAHGKAQYIPIIRVVLDLGANVNAMNLQGETALLAAVEKWEEDFLPIFNLLISYGANINHVNHYGENIIRRSILKHRKNFSRYLDAYIRANVDFNISSNALVTNSYILLEQLMDDGLCDLVRMYHYGMDPKLSEETPKRISLLQYATNLNLKRVTAFLNAFKLDPQGAITEYAIHYNC